MKSALLWAAPLSLLAGLGACGKAFDEVLDVPEGWTQLNDAVDPSQHIRLSIAMKQPYIDELEAKMAEKGNRLSMEEVRELQTPAQEDIDNVLHWLAENNLYGVVEKDFIRVWTTVAKAEPLLKMKLSRFSYEGKPSVLRTTKYTIPDSVADSISFINPITNFMSARHREGGLTFRLPPSKGAENANLQDLRQFLNQSAPNVAKTGRTINVELVNGGVNSQVLAESGDEAALDVDYAVSLGFPTNVTFYSTGGRGVKLNDDGQPIEGEDDDNEPYLEFFQYLLAKPDGEVPHVLSLSYSDDELSVPRDYAKRVCSLFGLLTARGTSIIFASGDGGARGGRASNCVTNDGTKRPVTMATFPPTCPWITSVGAVTNIAEPPNGARFSTGGFSQYFSRPKWQDDAVDGYVKELDGHLDGYYNESMRAIPDVSAVGVAFSIISGGYQKSLQGTSASAPVFASMIALINDARMRAGKKSLGFLNQHLYSSKVKAVLQDITAGKSASCIFNETDIPGGWPATQGWDAITGLGVPKRFDKLMEVLVNV
ncbi:tripeptidyl peptidase precursor [Trichoderma citrinoviride]|uniref:tripeptidyl-peptidase II n=1 Tax=Trichoderma citrinoviride TaxID=58853 RepID=A0A2T4B8N4_9HYPO|nr:tripeptidyl peptidase precursor [Trichoderma citrinoviride]PTB65670.1 tripeptidyl peptidase precursor [Trichoderma citrinoviride]